MQRTRAHRWGGMRGGEIEGLTRGGRGWRDWAMDHQGVTLVELMFVAVIFVLMGGIVFAMTQSGDQVWRRMDARLAGLTEAQRAMNLLSEDLRHAKRSGLTCGPGSSLVFTPVAGPGPVTYQLNGTELVKQVGTDPQRVVASGLTAFTPSCSLNGTLVQLGLTAQINGWHGPFTLNSQVWVQNP